MLNIFLLLLFIVSATAEIPQECPEQCDCQISKVTCVEKQLEEFPNFSYLQSKPEIIDLAENEIEELKMADFYIKTLSRLQYLNLTTNSIMFIEEGAFATMRNLRYLDLSNNLIENVPEEMITKTYKLAVLNLSGNLFSHKTPVLYSNSLEILDLSFAQISNFGPENLKGLPNLLVLNLENNYIKQIEVQTFFHTQSLISVQLNYNWWACDCNTTNLFDFLTESDMMRPESIKCLNDEEMFTDFYTAVGVVDTVHCKEPKNLIPSSTDDNIDMSEERFLFDVVIIMAIILIPVVMSIMAVYITIKRILLKRSPSVIQHEYDRIRPEFYSSNISQIHEMSATKYCKPIVMTKI